MYRKYLQEIADREKQAAAQHAAPTTTAEVSSSETDSSQNTNAQNTGSLETNNAVPSPNNPPNPGLNKTEAGKKLTAEEKKKMIDAQKKMLEDLMATANATEKMIFSAFPFQQAIICGNFFAKFPNTTKIIRIFTSSTFTDTKYERNSWMIKAYPKIKEHCFSKGYEFQVVDMRWGVRNQAADDHMTTELCIHELRECQKISKGPNFISLFAHKYGYRSPFRIIDAEEFRKIKAEVKDPADLRHLSRWYDLDKNAVPEVYILKSISKNIPDFLSKDIEAVKAGKSQWWNESERLLEIIAQAADVGLAAKDAIKYKISVTELETDSGLRIPDTDKKCFWFRKEFKDIEKQEPSYTLSRYIECLGDEKTWSGARAKNKDLRTQMESKLNSKNILTYELSWTEKGINPENKEHSEYLERITEDFQDRMISSIDDAIKEREENKKLALHPEHEEYLKHAVLIEEKCSGVKGRDEIVQKIKAYVLGDNKEPLVIHGESGCGKTSIMALAAKEAYFWIHGKGMVIARFLGTTQESSNVLTLLQSMVSQINRFLNLQDVKSQDLQTLVTKFRQCLRLFVIKKQTVVIFLDSIDQLDKANNGRIVTSWIPKNLIKFTKVIVSTIDQPEFGVFPEIKTLAPEANFIPVPLLTSSDRKEILDNFFQEANRTLTDPQRAYVLEMFEKCPLPLYIKLGFREAINWTSFRPMEECHLQETIRGCINQLLENIETKHGHMFVSRALGYVTAAKHGLSEFELEDVLSCDEDVLNDVYQFWTPPIRRLPPLLIVRLRYDLRRYLVTRGDSGVQILSWYHRQFWTAAEDRYIKDKATSVLLHTGLADYFMGRWSGDTPKPYQDRNGQTREIRYVASQPIVLGNQINERKMKSLPYHFAKSGNLKDLKKECLLNFEFLLHKLLCLPTEDLLDDFTVALDLFPGENHLDTLSQAINLSSAALSYDPRQLPSQLLDRLENAEGLDDLLAQCPKSMYPFMVCSKFIMRKPSGQLVRTLTGHTSTVGCVDLHQTSSGSLIAVSLSPSDNEIKTWNVYTGKEIKSGLALKPQIRKIAFAANGEIILQIYDKTIIGCNSEGELKYTITMAGNINLTPAGKNKSILISVDKTELALWDASSGKEIKRRSMPSQFNPGRVEYMTGSENYAAVTSDVMDKLCIYNIREDSFSPVVEMGEDFDINAMAITQNETGIVLSRGITDLVMMDLSTLQVLQKFEAYEKYSVLSAIYSHSNFLLACHDSVVILSDITGSDVSTHFPHEVALSDVKTCDMKTFVTIASDKIIRVWDISKEDIQKKLQTQENKIRNIIPMKNTRYAVVHRSTGKNPSLFEVYDVLKDKVIKRIALDCTVSEETLLDDDDTLILMNSNDKIKAISLGSNTVVTVFEGLTPKSCATLRLFNSGKKMIMQTRGRVNLKCYDVNTGKVTTIIPCGTEGKASLINDIMVSRDGHIVVCVTEDDRFLICDVEKKKIIKVFSKEMFGPSVTDLGIDVVVSSQGDYVIGSIQLDKKEFITAPFVWNKEDDKQEILFDEAAFKMYKVQGKDLSGLDMNEMLLIKDELLAVAYQDGAIRLWDIKKGCLHMKLSGHTEMVDLFGNPNGPYMMSFCDLEEENLMRIWDIESWECLASYKPDAFFYFMKPAKDGKSFLAEYEGNVFHLTLNGFDKNEMEKQELIKEIDELDVTLQVLDENDRRITDDDPDKEEEEKSDDDDDEDEEDGGDDEDNDTKDDKTI